MVNFAGESGKRVVLESGSGPTAMKLMQFRVGKRVRDTSHVPAKLLTAAQAAGADDQRASRCDG